ncbi:methyltransferase family protein [Methanococcoides alaskense]|uniref:methyltransferase family protein n=1 Tax=Methanococcoides alaskense TaxID=325778 RepID=UPI0022DDE56F|nr:isoprenylcysteine carboxylmethyltransferase family protein [Methanococcoides alaskense]MDA0524454.1 isoprenylcysteine carboxylmethyltransferase family protein [Methanococcoides alaskense]
MVSSTIILVLCLIAFAAIHSLTASLPFKGMILRVMGPGSEKYYMLAYSLISVLTVLPLIYLLYKYPGPILYIIPSPWRWCMVGGQLIGALIGARGLLDAPHRFKIRAQLSAPKTPEAGSLNIQGIFRFIRDPFLLSGLIIIWLTPFMTVNLLVIYIFSTLYVYLGSLHVERRLVSRFGDEYREYQERVHRTIPHFKGQY